MCGERAMCQHKAKNWNVFLNLPSVQTREPTSDMTFSGDGGVGSDGDKTTFFCVEMCLGFSLSLS